MTPRAHMRANDPSTNARSRTDLEPGKRGHSLVTHRRVLVPTRHKIRAAAMLSRAITSARRSLRLAKQPLVRRQRVRWQLDLTDAVDFGVYTGLYSKIPPRIIAECSKRGSLFLDVGANIGVHSLPVAKALGDSGTVIAIEPTTYAFQKLLTNMSLNPALKIVAVQAALSDEQLLPTSDLKFYSHWPLLGPPGSDLNKTHLGKLESALEAKVVSLDMLLSELVATNRISQGAVSFIRLSVVGHEINVLRGSRNTIANDRPQILIEIAPHIQDEVPGRFEDLLQTLREYQYGLVDPFSGREAPMLANALRSFIPHGGKYDALAVPI
jgi:FkbM family methyltransferase